VTVIRARQPRMGPHHGQWCECERDSLRDVADLVQRRPTEFSRKRKCLPRGPRRHRRLESPGDDHPDDAASGPIRRPPPDAPAPPSSEGSQVSAPRATGSGYAARGGTFTSVSATWTIPRMALDGPFGADATWIGHWAFAQSRPDPGRHPAGRLWATGTVTYHAWIGPYLTYRIPCR